MAVRFFLMVCGALAFSGQAHAINKCTGPDGRVAYQEGSCQAAAKAVQIAPAAGAAGGSAQQWRFLRQKDDMTGREACFALSPEGVFWAGPRRDTSVGVVVQLAVRVGQPDAVLTVRLRDAGKSFHVDPVGSGLKVGEGQFFPLTKRISSQTLGFETLGAPEVIGAISKGQSLRMRLSFWPYERLIDGEPIPLAGFSAAAAQAMLCAAK